jgi:hypothetical protein
MLELIGACQYATAYAQLGPCHQRNDDPELGKRLWEWMEEQVKDI